MATAKEKTLELTGKAKPKMPTMKVRVNGEDIIVDPATFTGNERRLMKRELAKLDYEPDGEDFVYAGIWIVLRRAEPDITLEEVLDTVTLGALAEAEPGEGDDSPEA